jgi:hypothetical protein
MTTSRQQTVFASLDPPQAWPSTRARPQPQRLDLELDALPGVGVTLKRKLAKLDLVTVRDLLEHRPHRYESAVDLLSPTSYDLTSNPYRPVLPRSRTWTPGCS